MAELIAFAVLLVIVALFVWVYLASDGEGDIVDDEPTLDVQNHVDDG